MKRELYIFLIAFQIVFFQCQKVISQPKFTQISSGLFHNCGVLDSGEVFCWGDHSEGQLGIKGQKLNFGEKVVQVSAGAFHSCALLKSGQLKCWGSNEDGQLGYGHLKQLKPDQNPQQWKNVQLETKVLQVVTAYHTCVLLDSGKVKCWGDNSYGRLGLGHHKKVGHDQSPIGIPHVSLEKEATLIAAGFHTCALLDDGQVQCWGKNSDGQLGYGHKKDIGDDEKPHTAGKIKIPTQISQISTGTFHSCASSMDGKVWCWGDNSEGQLGYGHKNDIGDDEPAMAAGPIQLGGKAIQISTGNSHTCAILDTGKLRCWGMNHAGQLGYPHKNNIGDDETPTSAGDVPLEEAAIQVSCGNHHTCVLLKSKKVKCWGSNILGQLDLE